MAAQYVTVARRQRPRPRDRSLPSSEWRLAPWCAPEVTLTRYSGESYHMRLGGDKEQER